MEALFGNAARSEHVWSVGAGTDLLSGRTTMAKYFEYDHDGMEQPSVTHASILRRSQLRAILKWMKNHADNNNRCSGN
jgi:hypothetical protein